MKGYGKKVISILLSLTMMCGVSMPIYADEAKAVNTTEAVTSVAEKSQDEHYNEAMGLLSYLKIFAGYEDGSMKPDSNITRAEMAAIILRMIKIDSFAEYNGGFADVNAEHWAANVIQTAYDSGIISGMGDGTFAPDEQVTYEQAVKMIVCAVNCGQRAEAAGGYPQGYLSEADRKDIIEHVTGTIGKPSTRADIAKLVYNAMLSDYPVMSGSTVKNGYTVFEYEETEGITLLSEKFDIYYVEGIVMATPRKSIDLSVNLEENQILFEDKVMNSAMENADDFVAQYCRVFYIDTTGDYDEVTAVYAVPNDSKTKSITIDAEDISGIVTGYDGGSAEIKYYNESNREDDIELTDKPIIVYNDNPFTVANYSKVNPTDENGDLIPFDEFITPETGSVKAVDFHNDRKYDILFIENYETSVVKLATAVRLQLKYAVSVGEIINLDKTKNDELNVFVTRDGEAAELRDLVENDVVSIKMNANFGDSTYTGKKTIYIDACSNYIDGKITGMSSGNRDITITIDGEKYECVNNESVVNDLKSNMGNNTKFLLDSFGRIAYAEDASTGSLAGGEKYGWLVSIYKTDSGDDVEVEMYTQDATMETYRLASNVDYWGSDDTINSTQTDLNVENAISSGTNGFTKCNIVDKKENVKNSFEIRLCKYKVNGSGKITRLYLAVDEEQVSEGSGAVRLDTKDYRNGKVSSAMFAGKYYIDEPVAQFTVPEDYEDRDDISLYKYRFAPALEFNKTGDSTVGYNCFLADASDYAPGIAIRLTGGQGGSASLDDYDTADDNRTFVITEMSTGIDDEDNEIYVIDGICDGEEVSYTTSQSTIVAHVNPAVRKEKTTYDTTTVWKDSYDYPLTDVLHEGDICGIEGTGSSADVILRMVDSTALADHLVNEEGTLGTVPVTQFRKDEQFSSARDRVVFGSVTDAATSPIVRLNLAVDSSTSADEDGDITEDGSRTVTIGIGNTSKAITIIYISKNGNVEVEEEFTDVYEIGIGDYVFMRSFKNDALRELYVVRYE